MERTLIFILVFSLLANFIYAQGSEKTLEARLSVIHKDQPGGTGPLMAVGISFINNSDRDIYVPEILKFSKGQSHFVVNVYKKQGADYKPFSYSKALEGRVSIGSRVPGSSPLVSHIIKANKKINDELSLSAKHFIEANNIAIDTNSFAGLNQALFLKAGEVRKYYFTVELLSPVYNEGEYMFIFEAVGMMALGEDYPNVMMGYHKLIPGNVVSNRLYLDLKDVAKLK